jgi:flagellar hook-length control protein FliK
MTVQAATPSIQEFAQTSGATRSEESGQPAGASASGKANKNTAFKKVLSEVKQEKTTDRRNSAGKKNFAPGLLTNKADNSETVDTPILPDNVTAFDLLQETPEAAPGEEELKASRFDPDMILGISDKLTAAVESESNETSDAKEDPSQFDESGIAFSEIPAEADKLIQKAPVTPDTVKSAEENIAPDMNLSSDKTVAKDISGSKNTTAKPGAEKPTFDTNTTKNAEFANILQKAADDEAPTARLNEKEPVNTGTSEKPVSAASDTKSSQAEQNKDDSRDQGKDNSDTNGKATPRRVDETLKGDAKAVTAHENHFADKSRENPVMPGIDAAGVSSIVRDIRNETPVAIQAPVTYTLSSGDAFGEGLTSVVEFMRANGTAEARIVVEPPALGRVDISLHSTSNGVEAVFKVDNEELKQMVTTQLDILKTSLEAQGIHVSSLTVDIRNNDGQKGRGDLYGSKGKNKKIADSDEADDLAEGTRIVRLDLERGLLHWVA